MEEFQQAMRDTKKRETAFRVVCHQLKLLSTILHDGDDCQRARRELFDVLQEHDRETREGNLMRNIERFSCMLEGSKLQTQRYLRDVQYQFEFQTMHTSRGREGVWYTTVLLRGEDHGADLAGEALLVFRQMQAVDRLIVFHLLELMTECGCKQA